MGVFHCGQDHGSEPECLHSCRMFLQLWSAADFRTNSRSTTIVQERPKTEVINGDPVMTLNSRLSDNIAVLWLNVLVAVAVAGCGDSAVWHSKTPAAWQEAFRRQVHEADSLEIVIGADCDTETEVATYRIEGRAAVAELVRSIEVQRYDGEFVSLCGGQDTLTFSRGSEALVTLWRTPLTALTWDHPKWEGDAVVSNESYRQFTALLEARGFAWLSEELDAAEEYAKEMQAENEAFVSDFPPQVQRLILAAYHANGDINADRVLQELNSSQDAFLAVCKCLGRLNDHEALWTMTTPLTRAVLSIAHRADESQFWDAVRELSDDSAGQLGAARLFFGEQIGTTLSGPEDLPVQLALAARVLNDGFDVNKSTVVWHLSCMSEQEAVRLLHDIAQGAVGTEIDPEKAWDDEPEIRFMALLGLAMQGGEIEEEEWEWLSENAVRPQDRAAVEIAGNLSGRDSRIRVVHFQFDSSTLGAAAIEALSRSPGPRSIGLLVEGGMEHPYAAIRDEAELAVQRMIGQSWERHERSRRIQEWLAAHSEAWIKPADDSH